MIVEINKVLATIVLILFLSLALYGWITLAQIKVAYNSQVWQNAVIQTIGQIQKDGQTILERVKKLEEMNGEKVDK